MTPPNPRAGAPALPIALVGRFDSPTYVGARWWFEGLEREIDGIARRRALIGLMALGVGLGGLGVGVALVAKGRGAKIDSDALEAQKSFGWNVGADTDPLDYQAAALGEECPQERQLGLATRLGPKNPAHLPYYRATLFQSLSATPTTSGLIDTGKALRDQMRPVSNAETKLAFDKGRALASLFAPDTPTPAPTPAVGTGAGTTDKAILVDLPGPLAVAFAAGLASRFDPVFCFDGWPHPRGVVPSHLTLGSALYYADLLEKLASERAANAAPAFILDRARLTPYEPDSDRFDNRYLGNVPSADALAALGVKQLLYVSALADTEADDLNEDFLAYKKKGLELRMVGLGDFSADPVGTKPPVALAPRGSSGSYESNPNVYYGGSSGTHYWFWHSYGWGTPRYAATRPVYLPSRPVYIPVARTTPFSGFGASRGRPSDFGRVTVHTSPSTGRPTGFSSRGSWGRGGSSSGSGA